MNKLLNLIFVLSLTIGVSSPVKARTNQEHNAKPIPLKLGFNSGITISWTGSSEVIQQIWLDNPSFATIDIFGCVSGWKGCTSSDAQIIHLKRNQDLKLKHIPFADKTLLTVVTKDSQNQIKLHFYEIIKHNQTASTLVVAAKAPSKIVTRRATTPVSQFGISALRLAEKMDDAIAVARQQPKKDYKLINKLTVFSNMLKKGAREQNALALSGMSPELVKQILAVE